MRRLIAWLAIEADDTVTAKMMDALLRSSVEDLKQRGFVTNAGVLVKEVKDGERPSPIPPEGFGFPPKLGKA